jgi:hypothetical protein
MEYLGAWGTRIHEKNLKSKISCQTPFKEVHSFVLALFGTPVFQFVKFKKVTILHGTMGHNCVFTVQQKVQYIVQK